jgi:Thioredoxin like C-terminal domain
VGREAAVLDTAGGSIAYRFEARDLNLVLAPPASGAPVRFAVLLDGQPPGDIHGIDVDESGEGTLSEPRMYQLVRERGPNRQRTFEITFDGPDVRAYVFTFG